MKLLLLSDLHGNIKNLDAIKDEFSAADAVLFAGDYTALNKFETSDPAVEKMRECHVNIFSVIGNSDKPELLESLEKQDMSVEHAVVFFEGLSIAGSGGASVFTRTTPNEREEDDLLSDFDVIKNSDLKGQWSNLILISHNPPKETLCDQCVSGAHVGSQKLSDFIKEIKPLAVITGHIHEGAGIDKIGETVVVNPGAIAEGNYAVMEAEKDGGNWKVVKTELRKI